MNAEEFENEYPKERREELLHAALRRCYDGLKSHAGNSPSDMAYRKETEARIKTASALLSVAEYGADEIRAFLGVLEDDAYEAKRAKRRILLYGIGGGALLLLTLVQWLVR